MAKKRFQGHNQHRKSDQNQNHLASVNSPQTPSQKESKPALRSQQPVITPIPDGWLEIGTIVAAHGLLGEMRVYPNTDFPERFEVAGTRWLLPTDATQPQEVKLITGSYLEGKNLYLIKLAGVTNRNTAEDLRGCRILVREDDRPQLAEGEYHIVDLIGCQVYLQDNNQLIGSVVNIIPAGNDLLEVETTSVEDSYCKSKQSKQSKQSNLLIPFVEAIVPVVDISSKRIEITPPDGLLELS